MQDSQWLTDLAAQENLWTIQYKDTLPSMLVAEWENLERLAKDGQVYGVLLQCRDLLEGVMKVPVVMALAILDSSAERKDDPAYVEVIRRALEKSLSMGDWQTLARLIVKKQKKLYLPENLVHILRCTLALYDNSFPTGKSIVEWRNDTIGHGSLRFEADEGYQAEVGWLLPTLHSYFDGDEEWSVNDSYRSMVLQSGDMQFTGDNFAIADENAKVVLVADGKTYPVQHFATNRDLKCLLFDSYYFYKSKTKFSSYTDGQELLQENHYFSDLYETYVQKNTGDEKIAARNITADDDRLLAQLDMPNDYVKPVQLMDKLRKTMAEMEKGVILVQMERGTGKSALAGRLNGLYYRKEDQLLKKSFVRCYHVSSANLRGSSDFVNIVNDDFKASYNAGDRLKSGDAELKQLTWNTETPAADFAEFLNFYNDRYLPENYTVFVLDGIDEMTEHTEQILNFVPASADLDDGVFVLLFSRFEDEKTVLGSARAHILRAKELANTVIAVERKSDINYAVLKEYAKKYAHTDKDFQKLIERADYRMLYLKADVLVRERAELDTTDETKFIGSYLNYVMSFYGTARQEQLKQTLAAIAMFHSVSLNQFVEYLGWPEITYGRIGMMNDLMPLLTVVHRDGETFYELADEAYADYVLQNFDMAIKDILQQFDDGLRRFIKHIEWQKLPNGELGLPRYEEYVGEAQYFGNGLVSFWNRRTENTKLTKYFLNRPELIRTYETLIEAYKITQNILWSIDSIQNCLLEVMNLYLAEQVNSDKKTNWIHKVNCWFNYEGNLEIERPDGKHWLGDYRISKQKRFKELRGQVLSKLSTMENPREWYWVLMISEETSGTIQKIEEAGQIESFSRYLDDYEEFKSRWNDVSMPSSVQDAIVSQKEEVTKRKNYILQKVSEVVAKLSEGDANQEAGLFADICCTLSPVILPEEYLIPFGKDITEILNIENFAEKILNLQDHEIGLNLPKRCSFTGIPTKGMQIALFRSKYGSNEQLWLPEFRKRILKLENLPNESHAFGIYNASWLRYELTCYYLYMGDRNNMLAELKQMIGSFENILFWGTILFPPFIIERYEELLVFEDLLFCTDNVIFYMNEELKDGNYSESEKMLEKLERDYPVIMQRIQEFDHIGRYVMDHIEIQFARLFRVCNKYGYSISFEVRNTVLAQSHLQKIQKLLENFSGDTNLFDLKDEIDIYLEPAFQTLDWEEIMIRTNNCIRLVHETAVNSDENYRILIKQIQETLERCQNLKTYLNNWDWSMQTLTDSLYLLNRKNKDIGGIFDFIYRAVSEHDGIETIMPKIKRDLYIRLNAYGI